MNKQITKNEYTELLKDIKKRIHDAQYQALKKVNKELINLYWDIGQVIVERQKGKTWGKAVVENLAKDLQIDFPGIQGFSSRNIWYMRNFYVCYHNTKKLQPMVAEIGWTHNLIIMEKVQFYIMNTKTRKRAFVNKIIEQGISIFKVTECDFIRGQYSEKQILAIKTMYPTEAQMTQRKEYIYPFFVLSNFRAFVMNLFE